MWRSDDTDFWKRLRAGKLDERDHDALGFLPLGHRGEKAFIRLAIRARARRILTDWGTKPRKRTGVMTGRGHGSAPLLPLQPPPAIVVKQVSVARPKEALRRIARYIGRLDVDYEDGKAESAAERTLTAADPADSAKKKRKPATASLDASKIERRPPAIFDANGNKIDRDEMLALLEDWGLFADREHLTPKGRRVLTNGGDGALRNLTEAEAFSAVQGRHIVISFPKNDRLYNSKLEEIARQFLKETFGAWGYPAIAAVHAEHGRFRHLHILVGNVKTCSLAIENVDRRRLRDKNIERFFFDLDGFMADGLRLAAVQVAEKFGFHLDASRREDRRDVVDRILAGTERLRPRPINEKWDDRSLEFFAERELARQKTEGSINPLREMNPTLRRLVQRAPSFVIKHVDTLVANFLADQRRRNASEPYPVPATKVEMGGGFIQRIFGVAGTPERPVTQPDGSLQPFADAIRKRQIFEDQGGVDRTNEAIEMWDDLRREDAALANTALVTWPELFGPVTESAIGLRKDSELVDLTKSVALPTNFALDPEAEKQDSKCQKHASPDARTALMVRAFNALSTKLEELSDFDTGDRTARIDQLAISDSYLQLAKTINAAFPDDIDMLQQAVELRRLSAIVRSLERVPTNGDMPKQIEEFLISIEPDMAPKKPASIASLEPTKKDGGTELQKKLRGGRELD